MIVYDEGDGEVMTRVKVQLVPETLGRWFWEVHRKDPDEDFWWHHVKSDGTCWGLRRAWRRAWNAGHELHLSFDG